MMKEMSAYRSKGQKRAIVTPAEGLPEVYARIEGMEALQPRRKAPCIAHALLLLQCLQQHSPNAPHALRAEF